jgi:sulfur relay protein TusB/DsrH
LYAGDKPVIASKESQGVLHLLPGTSIGAWRDCRACCAAKDTVVILDGGVMGLRREEAEFSTPFPCSTAVLQADARARGIDPAELADDVSMLDDAGFIALIERHLHCLSWR